MQSPHGNGLLTGNLRVGYMSRQRHPALEKKQDGTGRRHADRKKRPLPINHLRWKNYCEISYPLSTLAYSCVFCAIRLNAFPVLQGRIPMQSWSTHPTPTLNHMEDVIILGSGPAGCTAAIYTARAGCSTLILGGPLPGGLLTQTPKIENYPGFPEPVSGFDLTDAMLRQAENVGAKVRYNVATKLSLQGDIKEVTLDDGTTLQSRTVILALGAKHRPIEVKGRGRLQGKAISYCATCDGEFFTGKEAPHSTRRYSSADSHRKSTCLSRQRN